MGSVTTSVRGVIAGAKGEAVEVATVLVPDPGPGEAPVRVQACGVCHTDLHYREGGIGQDSPYLLGHEAAGLVDAVGRRGHRPRPRRLRHPELARGLRPVPRLQAGPPVVLLATHNAAQKMTLEDGTALSPRWASARSSSRPWLPRASAPRSTRAVPPEVAGLLGSV